MAHHHDCECGHDHHHEHEHESNSVQIDRYHEAFNKFEPALPDTQTTEAVNALLEKHFQENFTPEVLKTIHGCIDLTSLTSLDTKESIWKMVDTVNRVGCRRFSILTDIYGSQDRRNGHGRHARSR